MKEKTGKKKRETDQRKHKGQAMVLYLKPVIWFQINYILDEAPILWLPDVKSQIIGKDPNDGKD